MNGEIISTRADQHNYPANEAEIVDTSVYRLSSRKKSLRA